VWNLDARNGLYARLANVKLMEEGNDVLNLIVKKVHQVRQINVLNMGEEKGVWSLDAIRQLLIILIDVCIMEVERSVRNLDARKM